MVSLAVTLSAVVAWLGIITPRFQRIFDDMLPAGASLPVLTSLWLKGYPIAIGAAAIGAWVCLYLSVKQRNRDILGVVCAWVIFQSLLCLTVVVMSLFGPLVEIIKQMGTP
jgi:hypothetical protein